MRVFSLAFQSHLHFKMTICLCGWEGCNQFEINNSTMQPSPSPSPKPTTTKPTPKPTPTPTPKPGLQCLKCNGVPNPGNPNPDACDADQHFGDLTVTKPFSQLNFDNDHNTILKYFQNCSDELANATGPVYCFVQQLTGW